MPTHAWRCSGTARTAAAKSGGSGGGTLCRPTLAPLSRLPRMAGQQPSPGPRKGPMEEAFARLEAALQRLPASEHTPEMLLLAASHQEHQAAVQLAGKAEAAWRGLGPPLSQDDLAKVRTRVNQERAWTEFSCAARPPSAATTSPTSGTRPTRSPGWSPTASADARTTCSHRRCRDPRSTTPWWKTRASSACSTSGRMPGAR